MNEETRRVYVDSHAVDVASSATVLDAIMAADPSLAEGVRAGRNAVTDSRGLPISAEAAIHGGAIFRVVPIRQREV